MSDNPTPNRDRTEPSPLWRRVLSPAVCLAAALLLFSPSVGTGTFINSPDAVLRLPLLAHVRNVPAIFSRDFTFFTDGQYRPLGYAVLAALRTVVRVEATGFWHGLLVVLHALNTYLVYRIARRFARERVSVFLATGVFLMHPLASVFGNRMETFHQSLAAAFYLGGFLAYVSVVREKRARSYLVCLLLLAAGLLTSRILATLPLVLILYDALYERSRLWTVLGRCLLPTVLVGLMVPVWILMKPNPLFFVYPTAYRGVGWLSFASWVGGTSDVLLGLTGGWRIQAPLHEIVVALTHMHHWRFLVWAPIVLAALSASVWALLRKQWLGLGLLLMIVTQIPYCSTAFNHVEAYISWRTMYVPAAGFAICAAAVLDVLLKAVSSRDARKVVTMMAAIPIVLYGVLLCVENVQTRSAREYWLSVLRMNPKSEHAWVELGKTTLAEGDETEALKCLFRPQVKFIPTSCVVMGDHYIHRNDLLSAAVHLRYAINAPAAGFAAHNNTLGVLGDLSGALDALDYAEDFYARLLMRNPWHTPTMRKVARLLADKGYVRAAIRWMQFARQLEPDEPENQQLLASLIERHYVPKDPDAQDKVRHAHPQSPDWLRYAAAGPSTAPLRRTIVKLADCHRDDPVIQMDAGVCLAQDGKYEEAYARLDNATKALQSFSYAWSAKCHVALKLDKHDEAMLAGHVAFRLDRRNPDVLHNLGILYVQKEERDARDGDLVKAREAFEIACEFFDSALQVDPRNADTHNRFADLLLRRGELETAARHWEQAIRLGLDNPNTRGNLGYVLVRLGKVDEAIRQLRAAMTIDPEDASLHLKLSRALSAAGRFEESIIALSKARSRFPDDVTLSGELALLLASCPLGHLRDGKRAVALAETACRRASPVSAELLDVLAGAYAETGQFVKAIRTAERAAELARSQRNVPLTHVIERRIELYRRSRPRRLPRRIIPGP